MRSHGRSSAAIPSTEVIHCQIRDSGTDKRDSNRSVIGSLMVAPYRLSVGCVLHIGTNTSKSHISGRPPLLAFTAMTGIRKKPRQQRSRATWDAILEAAAQLFGERGYTGTTTNKVAE